MRKRLTAWRLSQQSRLRLMAAATIACDAVFSYVSTRNLAERFGSAGCPGCSRCAWTPPPRSDGAVAVPLPGPTPRQDLGALGDRVVLAANMADWRLAQNNWGSAVLSAVPPAMLAAQLLVLHTHDSGQPRRPATRTTHRVRPRARRAPGPKPAVPDADLLTQLREVEQTLGRRLTKRQIMTDYHVGDPRARRLLKQLHPDTPVHTNGAVLR